MKLDPAVIKLLKLDPENTSVTSTGGGGCSSARTSKITTKTEDGTQKQFFMKSGTGKDAEVMFKGDNTTRWSLDQQQFCQQDSQESMLRSEQYMIRFPHCALSRSAGVLFPHPNPHIF